MIEFIEGAIEELTPTHVIINCNGMGYHINISLYTYEYLQGKKQIRLPTYLAVKEDSHTLYGFKDQQERSIFTHLISVNGIGMATARMVLSSLDHKDFVGAILNSNVPLLKSIKGIGPKAAQRMIIELKDKFSKMDAHMELDGLPADSGNEAIEALMALGFNRQTAEKAIVKVRKSQDAPLSTEELIKKSLKLL